MNMNLVLFGAPGSGKGTQAERLRDRFSLKHISTGDLLREAVAVKSELGKKVESIMAAGELVSDEIVLELIKEAIGGVKADESLKGWMLDGYPRTVGQAKMLDGLLADAGEAIDSVVVLEVDRAAVIERLSSRRSCPECKAVYNVLNLPPKQEGVCDNCGTGLVHRRDDQPETISNRLDVYEGQTVPILAHYGDNVRVHRVDGNQPIDDVTKAIERLVQ
jgi:adenylate kinase